MTRDLHRQANLASWNESVSTHVASELYDVQGFREGACTLSAIERRELGPLVGRGVSLLHLQCHFGLDTLSWARRGAVVTGVDFSREAIEMARSLADDVGLSKHAAFLESDVYALPGVLRGKFDDITTSVPSRAHNLSPGGPTRRTRGPPSLSLTGRFDRCRTDVRSRWVVVTQGARPMSRSRMWLLVGVCAFVCAGSLIGLIVALSGPDEASPSTPTLSVDMVVVPEVMTAAHKVYAGQNDAFLAKTIIKNNGSEPVTNFHISYKIPGYAEIAGQEDYPVILPGQTVNDYCYPTFDAAQMKAIETETQAELNVNYTYDGSTGPKGTSELFAFLGHNDWVRTYLPEEDRLTFADGLDNAEMLAAFVTKDDARRGTSREEAHRRHLHGDRRRRLGGGGVHLRRIALLLHALRDRALVLLDAGRPARAVPAETIANESGNCVDLSVLFASLLEAVGVKTALCLSSGHCQVGITLPESGDFYVIEATAVDDPSIDLNQSVNIGYDKYNEQTGQNTWVQIGVEDEWANGMVPSW